MLSADFGSCVLQAELEEQRTAHHMESKRALEQQQSLDHCVESLMVAGTNLYDAKEQIEVITRSCIVLLAVCTQPLFFPNPGDCQCRITLILFYFFPLLYSHSTSCIPNAPTHILRLTLASASFHARGPPARGPTTSNLLFYRVLCDEKLLS